MSSNHEAETISTTHVRTSLPGHDVINNPVSVTKPTQTFRCVVSLIGIICGMCALILGALNIYYRKDLHFDLNPSSKRMIDGSGIFVGATILVSGSVGCLSVLRNRLSVVITYWCLLLLTSFVVYVATWFTISDIRNGKRDRSNCIAWTSFEGELPSYCDGHESSRLKVNILICAVFITQILVSGVTFCYGAMQNSCLRHNTKPSHRQTTIQDHNHHNGDNLENDLPPPYDEIYQQSQNNSNDSTQSLQDNDDVCCCPSIFTRASPREINRVTVELGLQ